jgi:hypothetical protein
MLHVYSAHCCANSLVLDYREMFQFQLPSKTSLARNSAPDEVQRYVIGQLAHIACVHLTEQFDRVQDGLAVFKRAEDWRERSSWAVRPQPQVGPCEVSMSSAYY